VTFFTIPGGLRRERWNALPSHAYAVAYDGERERIIAVGGGRMLASAAADGRRARRGPRPPRPPRAPATASPAQDDTVIGA
jgi:hypothetical protein